MAIHKVRGLRPVLHKTVFRAPSADVIGDVTVGEGSSLWFCTVLRGDVNKITVGKNTNIQDGSVVHGTYQKYPVIIGDGVSVGHNAMIHGCTIGNFVLVGMAATLLDGAVIGDECLIGAGSVVTQRTVIPPRSLVLGAPAKVIRPLTAAEIESLHDSARRYQMYVGWYRPAQTSKKTAPAKKEARRGSRKAR
jgi:carbonic anhydrase/acetyltransferase-like protein (isoleucine patch superfamily)